jgi:hypothetical protein
MAPVKAAVVPPSSGLSVLFDVCSVKAHGTSFLSSDCQTQVTTHLFSFVDEVVAAKSWPHTTTHTLNLLFFNTFRMMPSYEVIFCMLPVGSWSCPNAVVIFLS